MLKAQLNVRPIEQEWSVEFTTSSPIHEFEWKRFVMQAFREHVHIATVSLKSIHALRQKIENMAISKEVAVDVYEAHELLMATILQARVNSKISRHSFAVRYRLRFSRHSLCH